MAQYYYPKERVAIVAMGGLLPDASELNSFWNNILSKKVSIREVNDHGMDQKIFYRPEMFGKPNKNDKSYTKIAAIPSISNYADLTKDYKIPPAVAEHMDPNQHTAIYCTSQALKQLKTPLPKSRTAVILGTGAPGKIYDNILRRTFYARIENALLKNSELKLSTIEASSMSKVIEQVSKDVMKETLAITEDSAPGMLQNITASRVANVFDFWGPAYTIDAACASSLAAATLGVSGLLDGEFDAVITGGVDVTISEMPFVTFSGINALSPNGSYPFDIRANGFVMGLGGGVLILKRLSDAIRDGDEIISVISGYGRGSDGKGKYIAAPSEEGQARVIQSACDMAGYKVDTIEMIEAHGTGTIVGDVVEVAALKNAFNKLGATKEGFCGIGSVKSNIGHLRYASGAPAMIKASLALSNKILPPSANIEQVNPKLLLEGSPFYILREKSYWKEKADHPRRANVSSFGFGGANYHICLEEFRSEFVKKSYGGFEINERKTQQEESETRKEEVVFFSGDSFEDILEAVGTFIDSIQNGTEFSKGIFQNNCLASATKKWRIALCVASLNDLKEKWNTVLQYVKEGQFENIHMLKLKGIFIGTGKQITPDKIAWMFPGQGSQYPYMLKSIYENYPSIHCFYKQVDAIWEAKYGYSILPLIFGMGKESLEKEAIEKEAIEKEAIEKEVIEKQLKDTKNTHPSLFMSNIALYKLLSEFGVKADYMIGHSLGEITALHASGMVDLKTAVQLVGERGFAFDKVPKDKRGQMVSVKLDRGKTSDIISRMGVAISVANINAYDQTVVGGEDKEIEKLTHYLSKEKIPFTKLNVSHAFHTNLLTEAANDYYNNALSQIKFNKPTAKVMACHLTDFYPNEYEQIQGVPNLLKDQMISQVNFVESVLKLYEQGVRVFIEAGPSGVLSSLVKNILEGKDVRVISANHRGKDSLETLSYALAELFTCGVELSMIPLKDNSTTHEIAMNHANKTVSMNKADAMDKKESIVYSGVSVGLPGSYKKVFDEDNFRLLFEGKNLIEMLTDDERAQMLDLNIKRLIKSEESSVIKKVTSVNEVIQLVGKFGELDMLHDYLIDDKTLDQMVETVCAGVAAGYEALKDAGIPLVREEKRTASGAMLHGRLLLPEYMREDTGIIYANGFFPIEFIAREVSKYVAYKYSSKSKTDLIDFYKSVIDKVSDKNTKTLLSDWFTLHYSRLLDPKGEEGIYEFNHDFLNVVSINANNRLAKYIGAEGPNLFLSAACCSTATAVTIAEDMIRAKRAKRMIVIGSDSAATKNTLPWVGGGFLSMGSVTDSKDLFASAVPFDNRRKGMILGSGALGLILEKEDDVIDRGMHGVCRILGTHVFNSTTEENKIDTPKYCTELNRFLSQMEKEHQFNRKEIARKTVYSSHETYSPKGGGCALTEKKALESAFGDSFKEIKVINTKGMTGHTLHASIEEAVAAKALQYQKIPPIVNYKEQDPDLIGLNLSEGGSYSFDYVLRTIIAFGGNGSYHLLQKTFTGEDRIFDKGLYHQWLKRITYSQKVSLAYQGRLLVAEKGERGHEKEDLIDNTANYLHEVEGHKEEIRRYSDQHSHEDEIFDIVSKVTKYPVDMLDKEMEMEADLGIDTVKQATIFSMLGEKFKISEEKLAGITEKRTIAALINFINEQIEPQPLTKAVNQSSLSTEEIPKKTEQIPKVTHTDESGDIAMQVRKLISEVTKYPVEMLEDEMELEADLGIDTIKQATVFSMIGEKFTQGNKDIDISECQTIGGIIRMVQKMDEQPKLISEDCATEELCMQHLVFEEEEVSSQGYDLAKKTLWIIGDDSQTIAQIKRHFSLYDCSIKEFVFDHDDQCDYEEKLSYLDDILPDVIIDCIGLGFMYDDSVSRNEEQRKLYINSEARFLFYKRLSRVNEDPKIKIVCAISGDGAHGYAKASKKVINAFYGGASGFYKAIRKEWSSSDIKIVDLGDYKNHNLFDMGMKALDTEIKEEFGAYQVGYLDNKRGIIKIDYVDQDNLKELKLSERPHFLVTGGGYGITSKIVLEMAQSMQCHFTIIGRTKLPSDIHELSLLSEQQLEEKKEVLHDTLREAGEKITPVSIQKEYEKIKNAVHIYKTIQAIKESKSDACYMDCDITDFDRLKACIEKAAIEKGPVDVLIHAAGVEKSKLLSGKTLGEFKEVFDVKAKGLMNLYHILDKNKLKCVIAFSSISGIFGNEAQVDYCMANGFVSSYLNRFRAYNSEINTLSIAWSGWNELGMAWRNEYVKIHAEELGINLIEPKRGADEFIRILNHFPNINEVIVSKGITQFINIKSVYKETRMIDWVIKRKNDIEKVYKVLSIKRDPIINHHRLGSTPLMPAVGFMEMLAELHDMFYGSKGYYCFRNINLLRPLKLFYEEPKEVIVIPKRTKEDDTVEVNFYTYPKAKYESEWIHLNSMEISSDLGSYEGLMPLAHRSRGNMMHISLEEAMHTHNFNENNSVNLGTLFHDQYSRENSYFEYDEQFVIFETWLSKEQMSNKQYNLQKLCINPAFMDTLYQTCGIHSLLLTNATYLPWKVEEFSIINVPKEVGCYKIYAQVAEVQDDIRRYHLIMNDENGAVCCFVKNLIMRRIS